MTSAIQSHLHARASTEARDFSPEPKAGAAATEASPQGSKTTATISPAALAALAASKEAAETPEQTALEARGNDHQAQRLLAHQAAARKAYS